MSSSAETNSSGFCQWFLIQHVAIEAPQPARAANIVEETGAADAVVHHEARQGAGAGGARESGLAARGPACGREWGRESAPLHVACHRDGAALCSQSGTKDCHGRGATARTRATLDLRKQGGFDA